MRSENGGLQELFEIGWSEKAPMNICHLGRKLNKMGEQDIQRKIFLGAGQASSESLWLEYS